MACTFELLEIQIEEDAIMATMELGFKEPEVILIGDNSYVYMAAEMLEPECAMYIGTYLAVEIVPLDMEGLAVNGVTGKIKCKARALTMTAIAGAPAYMDLNIPLMGMEISADTPVTCTLTATAKKALYEMLGMSQNASDIDIRFKLMSITMAGDIGTVANIQVSMQPATMAMVTKQNISADIGATIALLKMKAGLLTDGPNNIDLVFEEPDTVISDDGGDCALADTLTFGG
jgi:hypothetical protein